MAAAGTDGATEAERAGARAAGRADKWSIVWILLALALWGCFAILLLSSYGPESHSYGAGPGEQRCKGPLIDPFQRVDGVCDSELRQWPALLGILALSTIATAVAAATTVYAKLLPRLTTTPLTRNAES
ncbi:hypothetical protein [Streptomyces sp. NPDC003719]